MSAIVKFEDQKQKNEIEYLKELVQIAHKSGNYKGQTVESLLNLMLTARDLGISPMKAINKGFHIINGSICMSVSLMTDRIREAGHSIKIPEWTSEKCVVIGVRKDNGDSVKFEYNMDDAKRAGLDKSPTWQKFPKNMLYARAMSTLARTLFPDVIGCVYSEDERHDIMNVAPERRPLEDPDMVTIQAHIETPVERLDEEQINHIRDLIQQHAALKPEVLTNILNWVGVTCLEDVPMDKYHQIVTGITSKYGSKVTRLDQGMLPACNTNS